MQDGRDRAGLFCAALMMWTMTCTTAKNAIDGFANRRTDFRLGETSQVCIRSDLKRMVYYEFALARACVCVCVCVCVAV